MTPVITPEDAAEKLAKLRALRAKVDAEMRDLAGVIDRANRRAAAGIARRPRSVIPPCGTESAYQRHRHYGELRDEACKAAHAKHTAEKYAERKARLMRIAEGEVA